MKHGKHYVDAAKLVDSTKAYDVNEALELACKTASAKFDETVELHVRLGVDMCRAICFVEKFSKPNALASFRRHCFVHRISPTV